LPDVKVGVSLERSILHFVPFNCNRWAPKGSVSSSTSALLWSWKHGHYRHIWSMLLGYQNLIHLTCILPLFMKHNYYYSCISGFHSSTIWHHIT